MPEPLSILIHAAWAWSGGLCAAFWLPDTDNPTPRRVMLHALVSIPLGALAGLAVEELGRSPVYSWYAACIGGMVADLITPAVRGRFKRRLKEKQS